MSENNSEPRENYDPNHDHEPATRAFSRPTDGPTDEGEDGLSRQGHTPSGHTRLPAELIASQETFSRMWTLGRTMTDAVEAEQATLAALALAYATRAPDAEVTDAERAWKHAHRARHNVQAQLAAGSLGLVCDQLADRLLATARLDNM